MLENLILNLDVNQAKSFLKSQNIHLSDDEIRYLLPILQKNVHNLKDPQKRQSIISTLPYSYQSKINELLSRYQNYL